MGERKSAYRILAWRHDGKSHLQDTRVEGMIILKCFYKK